MRKTMLVILSLFLLFPSLAFAKDYYGTKEEGKIQYLRCTYKDKSGNDYYDGISIQLVYDDSTRTVVPQFYFPNDVKEKMLSYGILYKNTNKENQNSNIAEDKYIYKIDGVTIGTLTYLMGYNEETLKYDTEWNKIINTVNHDVLITAGTRKVGIHHFTNGKAATVEISIKDIGDKAANEFVDDQGNVSCPSNIGVVFPKDNYKIEDAMQLGNYDELQNKYEVQVIFPNSNEYQHTDMHHNLIENDNNGDPIYYEECYDTSNSEWKTCTYKDEDYDIGKEYYVLLFKNNWSEYRTYTAESAEDAKENIEMMGKYCDDVISGKNYVLGSDSFYVSDGNTGNYSSTCYYKVYNVNTPNSITYKEFTWRNNVDSAGMINGDTYNVCKFNAGAVDYNNCKGGSSSYYYNSGIKPMPGEMLITKTDLNNNICTSFYEKNESSYTAADTQSLCKNNVPIYYYCACEYVSKCQTGIGNSTKNIWDCSKCNLVDPCTNEIQKGYNGAYYCGIFGEGTWKYIQNIYTIIKILIPALVIVLGMVDFMKVVFSGEEKDMKTAGQRFLKRIIAGIIFILLPVLLQFMMRLFGFSENCLQELTWILR